MVVILSTYWIEKNDLTSNNPEGILICIIRKRLAKENTLPRFHYLLHPSEIHFLKFYLFQVNL